MAEYGLSKNAEGYADPTAAEAIKGMAKAGEIWAYKGREVLIVKNQGAYSNVLSLSDHIRNGEKEKVSIEVAGRYTEPGMLSYAFNSNLGAFVERITKDEYDFVLKEVYIALSYFRNSDLMTESPEESKNEPAPETNVRMDYEAENKALKKKNSLLRAMYDDLLTKFIDRFGGCEDHG